MTADRRINFWMKAGQALFLTVAVTLSLGATDAGSRANSLSHKMMCTCGCAQMLGECNHVGCPSSGPMLVELSDVIASGKTDQEVLDWFTNKYGVTVLAAPTTHGFNLVAWIAPIAVFLAALLGTILLVRNWSVGRTPLAAGGPDGMTPEMSAIHDKIRRETGADGGF
jgi:cytochrome c-type biogenesis protein CcmH/NrfF